MCREGIRAAREQPLTRSAADCFARRRHVDQIRNFQPIEPEDRTASKSNKSIRLVHFYGNNNNHPMIQSQATENQSSVQVQPDTVLPVTSQSPQENSYNLPLLNLGRSTFRLLSEPELSFKSACQIAQAGELAERQMRSLSDGGSGVVIGSVCNRKNYGVQKKKVAWKSSFKEDHQKCSKCGKVHLRKYCPATKWKCYVCNRFGHIKRSVGSRRMRKLWSASCCQQRSFQFE
ncbi:hypothetical protein FQR65_LT07497 [Abscondita terminalis]|nr:hypothetical protein FQR65_LT07497 [Abscondita terminalis]